MPDTYVASADGGLARARPWWKAERMTNWTDDVSRIAGPELDPDPIARLVGDRGEGVISAAITVCGICPYEHRREAGARSHRPGRRVRPHLCRSSW
jgi:hypothetical protein